jgi:hypothetical protein
MSDNLLSDNLLGNYNFSIFRGKDKSRPVAGSSGDLFFPFSWFWRDEPEARMPWCLDYTSGWKIPEYQQVAGKPPFVDETGWIEPPATIQYADWTPPTVKGKKKNMRPFRLEYEFAQGLFASGAMYDGGFYQDIRVTVGQTIKAGGRVHAWSNTPLKADANANKDDIAHSNDPNWTTGIGAGAYRALAPEGWPNIAGKGNISLDAETCIAHRVGIDPTGGTDFKSKNIVWGAWTISYNRFGEVDPVTAVAQADRVTIWWESACRWPFGSNPSYWSMVYAKSATEPEPPDDGVNYVVTVNLLPRDATKAEKLFVLDRVHESGQAILQNANDARRLVKPGLPGSKVVVWAAARWPGNIVAYLGVPVEFQEFDPTSG